MELRKVTLNFQFNRNHEKKVCGVKSQYLRYVVRKHKIHGLLVNLLGSPLRKYLDCRKTFCTWFILLFFIVFATLSLFDFLHIGGWYVWPGYIHMINLKPGNCLFSFGIISLVALTMISKLHCMPNGGQNFNAKFGWKCFAKHVRHILCFFGKSWHLNTLVPALMWFPCRQKTA